MVMMKSIYIINYLNYLTTNVLVHFPTFPLYLNYNTVLLEGLFTRPWIPMAIIIMIYSIVSLVWVNNFSRSCNKSKESVRLEFVQHIMSPSKPACPSTATLFRCRNSVRVSSWINMLPPVQLAIMTPETFLGPAGMVWRWRPNYSRARYRNSV